MTELVIRAPLGHLGEERFAGRPVDELLLDSAEAVKRRLRRTSAAGRDVALDLERGSFLRAGTVLAELDGEIVVALRRPERALVVRFSDALGSERLWQQALALGHALGNQHVPVEVAGAELRIPVTTSESVLAEAVRRLGLDGLAMSFEDVRLAEERPLAGHGHEHGH